MQLGCALLLAWGMGALAFWRPLVGLCVFAALFPFDVMVMDKAPITVYLDEALLTGLLAGVLDGAINNGARVRPDIRRILILFAFVLVAVGCSAWAAPDRWAVFKQALRWGQFWLLLAVVAHVVRNNRDAKNMLTWYVGIAAVVSVMGIVEVALGPGAWINRGAQLLEGNSNIVRAHGPLSPNALPPYLGLALLTFVAMFRIKVGWIKRMMLWGIAGLVACALLLTHSRTGWIAVAAGVAVCVAISKQIHVRRTVPFAMGLIALIFMSLLLSPALRDRASSLMTPWKQGSYQFRMELFKWGMKMWKEHPFIGAGAGNYPVKLKEIRSEIPSWLYPAGRAHVHNFFLQVGLETGLLGLAAWLVGLGWIGWRFWRERARAPDVAALGLGLMVIFFVNNMFEHTLIHSRGVLYALGFGSVLGVLGARTRIRKAS